MRRLLLNSLVAWVFSTSTIVGQEAEVLTLTVVRGEGAFNDINRHTADELSVLVQDQNGKPVTGAQVTFSLPYSGPGGMFERNGRTSTTTTGPDGRAAAARMRPNSVEGRFNIRVTAAYGGKEGSTVISQTNTLASTLPGRGGHHKLLILGLLGGAGAAVGLVVGRGGKSTPVAVQPTVLSPGPISVGGLQ